ncbi:n/a [Ectocarpus siliculosus]|uniref:N/a n=1 Tax=Ectocarpus siliculosus TaxID=2880 RepID=D7FZC8_ECTSI|nr:n/a [Ectocarpus siliculosus]|eukprot:CBJ32745.1 n/a [Ectocarpus siliculosus]
MIGGVIRRSVPRASGITVDWAKMAGNCVAAESKSFVIGLKQEVAQADAMHEKYSKQPEPIDWASYKEFFGNHPTIAKLQEEYESTKQVAMPAPEAPEMMMKPVAVGDPKDIDWEGSWKTYGELFDGNTAQLAAAQTGNTEAKVVALADKEQLLKNNMTNDQTTVADIFKKYPQIEQECNDEVANHEWCTNLK